MANDPEPMSHDDPRVRFAKIREEIDALNLPEGAELREPQTELGTGTDSFDHLEDETELEPGESELAEIDDRIRSAGNVRMPDLPALPEIRRPTQDTNSSGGGFMTTPEDARGLGIGLTVAYGFIGMTLVGIGLGYLGQKLTNNPMFMALGVIGGFVLGMLTIFVLLNRNRS